MRAARPFIVLAVGIAAYVVSVTQRSSLGVAAVEATQRFDVGAAELSTLAVAQLAVYAAMQVPAGVLLDRLGPRAVLAGGAVVMAAGQLVLAMSDTVATALLARMLVGAGDAAAYVSVLRLVAAWFPRRVVPVLSQIVASTGLLGQVVSAFPLLALLHLAGWSPAYLSAAALSVLTAIVVVVVVRLPPWEPRPTLGWRQSLADVRAGFARPGTQLGFWSHFVTAGPANAFLLLWGFPFLSVALGYGPALAGALLTVSVVSSAVTGPVVGVLTARFPLRRSSLVLAGVAGTVAVFAAVLAWPPRPPLWLVIALVVVLAASGSLAFVGIDFARTFNPPGAHGSVTGFANVGGFTAALIAMLVIGIVLDAVTGPGTSPAVLYTLPAFRAAFAGSFAVTAIGVVVLLHARRRTRRRMFDEEGIAVAPLGVALREAWRRRRHGHGPDERPS